MQAFRNRHKWVRHLRERLGLIAVITSVFVLVDGGFTELFSGRAHWPVLSLAGILVGACVWRVLFGWSPRERTELTSEIGDRVNRFELGALLLTTTFVLTQATGGISSWIYPMAYVVVAYLAGFNTRVVGLLLTVFAVGLHVASEWSATRGNLDMWAAVRAGYLVLFGVAGWIFLQVEIATRRRKHHKDVADAIRAMQREAQDFRLISSSLTSGDSAHRSLDEEKLARGAIESIHQNMFLVLSLLKRSLNLQTCVLLWLETTGRQLRIKEMVTDSDSIVETPISAHSGALGGIVKNRLLLNLRRLRPAAHGIPYYDTTERVGAFVGVPVLENGHLRGVLCADRREQSPFIESEERLLLAAARQILASIQTERVLATVERSKYEHERFYRASTMLNGALTLSQVYETAFRAAREITPFDYGAVTLYDTERRRHTICRVYLDPDSPHSADFAAVCDRLEGQVFGDNAGLVSMAVKNRHFLPAGNATIDGDSVIFTKKLRLPPVRSLVVFPLVIQDQAVGTFVVAAQEVNSFSKKCREMLGVICNQVSVAVENAKMYRRMEEMATTDGLTELPNHRTFQARFSEMLARAERHSKPVSLILTDIDRFKSINDTYGHPVGDQVLKRVSSVLAQQARKVDVVARYGGEEFAIVLEETDMDGARLFCERAREEVSKQVIVCDKGNVSVTISLGIATCPTDGLHKQELIERADKALYGAKETGRNRTICYNDLIAGRRQHRSRAGEVVSPSVPHATT